MKLKRILKFIELFVFLMLFPVAIYSPRALADYSLPESLSQERLDEILESRECNACIILQADLSELDLSELNLENSIIRDSQFIGSDLTRSYLGQVIVTYSNFSGADLSFVDFRRSNLNSNNFEDANLAGVNLQGSSIAGKFRNAFLGDVDLSDTEIRRADFAGANLTEADFSSSNLEAVSFINADLRGVVFDQATFGSVVYSDRTQLPEGFSAQEAGMYLLAPYSSVVDVYIALSLQLDLKALDLTGMNASHSKFNADFSRATLDQALFEEADLFRSDFTGASAVATCFVNAQLELANLTRANFQATDLRGTDLRDATIDDTNFRDAIYNAETQFPEEFNPEAAGAIFSDEVVEGCPPIQ